MKCVFEQNPAARRDLIRIFQYLTREGGLRTARRFLSRAEATFQRLASQPNIGESFEPGEARLEGLRYCPISRYKNFIVFYRSTPDGIEVLRVLHGSRDLEGILATDIEAVPDDDEPDPGPE